MKRFRNIILIFVIFLISSLDVLASTNIQARIGNNYYDTLEEAISASHDNDSITLTTNVNLEKTLIISKNINLDLNNKTITAPTQVFLVEGGSLNLKGNGLIKETKPDYGAIVVKGSKDLNANNYSTVTVNQDVTLEGWSGIFIDHNDTNTAYGVLINIDGTIKAIDDINGGKGAGIYVNGNIQELTNNPVINLGKQAKITSTGNGIYSAGFATYNINGAYIEGVEAGLGIKAGTFNINSGTILGTGEDKTPTSGNNNGINPSGASIQIESNNKYAGEITLDIKSGTIKSNQGNSIYEYTVDTSPSKVKKIDITDGDFLSAKDTIRISPKMKNNHHQFIKGGVYSTNPNDYLASGYTSVKNKEGNYEVILSTMNVFKETNKSENTLIIIIIILFIMSMAIIIYKKQNIKKIFKYK